MTPPALLRTLGLFAVGFLLAPGGEAQHSPALVSDQKDLCLGCHDLGEDLEARVQHAPVESGECTACHNPHVARFKNLLRERPGPLCANCHEDVSRPEQESIHGPVAEGRCAACHQPHGSPHQGLLVEASRGLCLTCHEEVAGWKERAVQHSPFAQGRCSTCHEPHSSDNPGLLTRGGASLCASCHQMDASLRAKHEGYPVEKADCHQCHDPHASSRRGLFRESVHPPFEAGDCTSCHNGPTGANPLATLKPVDQLCADCHQEAVEESRHAAFPHVSAGGGRCVACHNPHTGDSGLLNKPVQALCVDCHDPGGALSGREGRHLTHSGFDCTTCHQPHGGDRPLMFVDDSIEMCGTCHTHEHGVRHPLGEETLDPRTDNPMTCLSCHGLHQADGEMYLFEADQRMLCVGCHKDLRGR